MPSHQSHLQRDSDAFKSLGYRCSIFTHILILHRASFTFSSNLIRVSTHALHNQVNEIYFCTVTCYRWMPLLKMARAYHSVYRWFHYLRKDKCYIVGYVIMPNHLHVLLLPTKNHKPLNYLVGEGKRFMAYSIIKGIKQCGYQSVISYLAKEVSYAERTKGKKHQVFNPSFDSKICYSEKIIIQKLEYIHHNPVNGKWNLAVDFTDYPFSSAGFYELGKRGRFQILHYKDIWQVFDT